MHLNSLVNLMQRWLKLILLHLIASPLFCATHAGEVRSTWLARDSLTSKDAIATAMNLAAANNFNVVYVNAWSRGYPLWRSQTFSNETGIAIDPTFSTRDVMAEAIAEGHQVGLHVVAWMEYGFVGGYTGWLPGTSGKGKIFDAHPDWVAQQQDGTELDSSSFYWMAHTRPDVQQFLINLTKELVSNYDLDGVELDRIRLSSLAYGYDPYSRSLYAAEHGGQQPPTSTNNAAWMRWRADKLNLFHAAVYDAVKALYPRFIVANAPSAYGSSTYASYNSFCQDWVWWLVNGKVDALEMQCYVSTPTSFSNNLRYVSILASNHISKISPAFGLRPNSVWIPHTELPKYVDVARNDGFSGQAVWYHNDLTISNHYPNLYTNRYAAPAAPGYLPADWRNHRHITAVSNTADAVRSGTWTTSANAGYSGTSVYASSGALAAIDYYCNVPTNGIYEVYAFNVVSGNRATNAPYACFDAYGNIVTNYLNQTLTANTRWVKLGDVLLAPGRRRVAQLSNQGVASPQLVSADALMISLNRRLSERPALAHLGGITNGLLALQIGGNVNQRIRIEVSTNMVNWDSLTNVTMPGALGNFTITTTNSPLRFYRAALAP
jgi:uncharacterized lipoprotein YddW (UPF0748 family)